MKNNFSSLVKQEMVNRFESVVKNEILVNNRHIEETNKSLDMLRKEVDSFKNDYQNLKSINQDLYDRLSVQFNGDRNLIESKFKEHISSTANTLEKFFQQLNYISSKVESCLSKENHDAHVSEEKRKLEDKYSEFKNCLNDSQIFFERLYSDHLVNTQNFFKEILKEKEELSKRVNEVDVKFEAYKVEFQGLLKEIRVYKRENFIQAKEIEKLFILIDRLEKRIEK